MITEDLFQLQAAPSSIFLDNLTICSADRLISGNYAGIRDDPIFQGAGMAGSDAAKTLISHDLVNLAILIESLLCFDHVYVNAEYIDRWNSGIHQTTLSSLESLISGVTVDPAVRWQMESSVIKRISRRLPDGLSGVAELSNLVTSATHNDWDRGRVDDSRLANMFSPYVEASRAFPGAIGIGVGAGFYVACSQLLGVPYRPSALRARMLADAFDAELKAWRDQVGHMAFRLLEESRSAALEKSFASLVEMNLIEFKMPAALAAVLSRAKSAADVIPVALSLRESREARKFRQWCGELSAAVLDGSLDEIVKLYRVVKQQTEHVNKRLGFGPNSTNLTIDASLAWGLVKASPKLSMPLFPDSTHIQIHRKRHALFIQDSYKTLMGVASFSRQVRKIFYPQLPEWFYPSFREESIWRGYDI